MHRVFVVLVCLLMIAGGALADGAPDWVPAGFSFYQEEGFALESAYPMADGGVVLAGQVRGGDGKCSGLAVRLSAGGEVIWKHWETSLVQEAEPYCDVRGVLPDGRVLLLSAVPALSGNGFTPGTDLYVWKAMDDGGIEEVLEDLMRAAAAVSAPSILRRMPDGFAVGGQAVRWGRSAPSGADAIVMLGEDFEPLWRVDLSGYGKVLSFDMIPAVDGYFLYGTGGDGTVSGTRDMRVIRLDAEGKELWSLVQADDHHGISAICAMPDGGVVFRSTYAPEGESFRGDAASGTLFPVMQYTRLDRDGKHLWTTALDELDILTVHMAPLGDEIVISGFYDNYGVAMALVSDGGDLRGVWSMPETESERRPVIAVQLFVGDGGTLLAAGSVEWGEDGERLPATGVLFRVLDVGLFE